ncbi:hypothetical protein ABVT39_007645 [Epinephelus coioides]
MESLPPGTRDCYSALCQALRDEYSLFTDPASAAFAITQRKQESLKEYYRRLRVAYFQGRNAPGLEEEHGFKSLFLHNLHETVRYDVAVYCRTRNLPMQEIRRYAQMVWEIRVRLAKKPESDTRVLGIQAAEDADLALEGNKMHQRQSLIIATLFLLLSGDIHQCPGPASPTCSANISSTTECNFLVSQTRGEQRREFRFNKLSLFFDHTPVCIPEKYSLGLWETSFDVSCFYNTHRNCDRITNASLIHKAVCRWRRQHRCGESAIRLPHTGGSAPINSLCCSVYEETEAHYSSPVHKPTNISALAL